MMIAFIYNWKSFFSNFGFLGDLFYIIFYKPLLFPPKESYVTLLTKEGIEGWLSHLSIISDIVLKFWGTLVNNFLISVENG